jgi:hypothetical protein
MAAWAGVLALSGFLYDGRTGAVEALPRVNVPNFRSFWSTGTGWGAFSTSGASVRVQVLKGKLSCRSVSFRGTGNRGAVTLGGQAVGHQVAVSNGIARIEFTERLTIAEGVELRLDLRA